MRVLLDTNIIIHREATTVVNSSIGVLFRWLDRLKHEKCVHPISAEEIKRHQDPRVAASFEKKLQSYSVLKTVAPDQPKIASLRKLDVTANDIADTTLLNELVAGRIDAIITEDRGLHKKALGLGFSTSVFSIDSFLEKATAENPELADYKVLSVRKSLMGKIQVTDSFFDSFRSEYPGFDKWFNRKADETAYICTAETGEIIAFLYLKKEGSDENYSDITPALKAATRIKIGTMKVAANGNKLGERFLKIVFDNAMLNNADEIYVTALRNTEDQIRLLNLLEDWGFNRHGTKTTSAGTEEVYVRDFSPQVSIQQPKKTYPFLSAKARKFIVPIYPEYHTELLPDSVLRTESPEDFVESRPNRNAIAKVYISRSINRDLRSGDLIVFYRTKYGGPAFYTSVATTIAVVENVHIDISSLADFQRICRKRSVFSDVELARHWNYDSRNRPFVVDFLYVYTFPKRMNLKALSEVGILTEAPRGFESLSDEQFRRLCEGSDANKRYIID